MSLAPHQRRNAVMSHEGQILTLAGNSGPDTASDYARCVIDGAMNAIIRMEGAEKASAFAFGVADRVAGGLREPTVLFPASAALPAPVTEEEAAEADALADEVFAQASPPMSPSLFDVPTWLYPCALVLAMCAGFVAGQGWPR